MNGPSREEFTAKQESIEVRMDGKLALLEKKMDAGFAALRAEMDAGFAAVRAAMEAGFAAARTDMLKAITDLVKWMVGLAIVVSATGITVMTFVLNYAVAKPELHQAAAAPAPVVIYLPTPTPIQPAPQPP